MKFTELTTKSLELSFLCQSFRTFFNFDNIVSIFDPSQKYTSIRNSIGSRLKCVATSGVSKRYQTSLSAQLLKTLFENVNFELNYPIFNIQRPSSKVTRYEVNLPQEDISSNVVG